MYELDVLGVGNEKDADAITARFTRPDNGAMAHIVIDAGWQADGEKVVKMLERYEAPSVDLAIVTHPDGDHIGGMGKVFDHFKVKVLVLHRLDQRGGAGLPAADAVKELVEKAQACGTEVTQPRPGMTFAQGALTVLGPSDDYYNQLVQEQLVEAGTVAKSLGLREAVKALSDRVLGLLPTEVPFGDGPGTKGRNNSSVVNLLQVDGQRILLTADAGVPAIESALDYAKSIGYAAEQPTVVQIPHHGSRRNGSSALLDRLLGGATEGRRGEAFVSVVSDDDPKHPAGRIVNAYKRRGYPYFWTANNKSLWWHSPDAPPRYDYSMAAEGPILAELADDA
jgi:beta-lactamase superfamily II metal-dependent hydrolase